MQTEQAERAQAPHIFVVDDEQVIATTISLILRKAGYAATAFFNPVKLLQAMEEGAPDLVISDIMMPQMSGVDLAILLRRERPDCKVVLFSGQAATSEVLDAARREGHEFRVFAKPLHPTKLLSHVGDLLREERPELSATSVETAAALRQA
jgi:DNA-binding NtrC family response regulator